MRYGVNPARRKFLLRSTTAAAMAAADAMIPAHKIGEDGGMTVRGERLPNTTTIARNVSLSSCASLASLVLPAGLTTSIQAPQV